METDFEFKKYDFLWALFLFGLCILFYLVAFKPYSNEIQTETVQLNYNLPNSNKGYDISKSDNTLTYSDKGHIKTINLDPSLDIDISYVSKGNAKKQIIIQKSIPKNLFGQTINWALTDSPRIKSVAIYD